MRRLLALVMVPALCLAQPQPGVTPEPITPEAAPAFAALAVHRFDAASGLMPGNVGDLALSRDGRMWAASVLGAYAYDGVRWNLISGTRELAPILRVLAAGDDVWIGGTKGLARVDDQGLHALELPLPLGLGKVERGVQALSMHAGALYAGVDGGLYRCEHDACVELPAAQGLRVATLRWQGEQLWIGTAYEGLYVLEGGALRPAQFDAGLLLPSSAIRSLLYQDDVWWIGAGRGVVVADGENPRVYGFKNRRSIAMALVPDPAGKSVWSAQMERGLGRLDAASWRQFGVADGLPADRYSALAFDASGQLWVGGEGGVLRLDAHAIGAYDERHGLPQQSITGVGESLFPDSGTAHWLGTRGGSVRWLQGRWRALPEPLSELTLVDVARLGDSLYLAFEQGFFSWDAKGIEAIDLEALQFPASYASQLWTDAASGELWMGSGHGVGHFDGKRFEEIAFAVRDSGGPSTRAFLPGRDGSFWILHREGMLRIRAGAIADDWRPCPGVQFWNAALELSPDRWLLASDAGLYLARQADQSCAPWPLPGLAAAAVEHVLRIGAHELAVLRSDGLARVEVEAERAVGAWLLTPADGLPSTQFRGQPYLDGAGLLWMGTAAGLAVYDLARPRPPAEGPLRWVHALAGATPLADDERLPPQRASLKFAYRVPSLVREHAIRYCRTLVGAHASDELCDGAQSVEYSRLPAGDYVFKVHAFDAFGRPAGMLEKRFSVLPVWWLRPAFLFLAALLLLLLGVLGGRARTRSHARRARELERQVASRTAELADANLALAEAAYRDPLTGAGNRRDFIHRALPGLRELGRPFVLMLVDGDHFKAVNDTYGHHAGDAVLIAIAQRLSTLATAPVGGVYRWGGEEFLLALPVEGAATAAILAERALALIHETQVSFDAQAITVTVSIGWTLVLPGSELERIDQSIARADRAVYQAKREGRDRAVMWAG
jgi:diguanylate cyclase (GGDEF)-like protein